MGAQGACGVRFNAVSGNGTPLEQLEALGERLASLGWHLQLYAHSAEMVALESILARLPCPLVIDHMGGVKTAEGGVDNAGFKALLRLLEGGAWAKLCGYRSSAGHPYADVAGMARAMIAAAPDRCVWGTDWPHPSLMTPEEVPDDGHLMDLLAEWAPAEAAAPGHPGGQPGAPLRLLGGLCVRGWPWLVSIHGQEHHPRRSILV